jgi:hypothetical protein
MTVESPGTSRTSTSTPTKQTGTERIVLKRPCSAPTQGELTSTSVSELSGSAGMQASSSAPVSYLDAYVGSSAPQLAGEILSLLANEPVETGKVHPITDLLRRSLQKDPSVSALVIQETFNVLIGSDDGRAAGLLRGVARLPKTLLRQLGTTMATTGLASADVDLRQAALALIDSWGAEEFLKLLRTRPEPNRWLALYSARLADRINR